MYFSYLLYQAGRDKSPREQLEADIRTGQRAKAIARLWHALLPARHQPAAYEIPADDAIGIAAGCALSAGPRDPVSPRW